MKITKKNGHETIYDDEKVINSILKANEETYEKSLSRAVAADIAGGTGSIKRPERTDRQPAGIRKSGRLPVSASCDTIRVRHR